MIRKVVPPRRIELGGFTADRLLPAIQARTVGPFVFLDHIGPAILAPGNGIDVRPHPHIGLSTVTYLFAGELFHRDSLGSAQAIQPGAINWMTAGRGIVHSERTAPATRAAGGPLHGLQLWVALPEEQEETAPAFRHHAAATLPSAADGGAVVRLLAGTAFGLRAPAAIHSPLFYLDVELALGASIAPPAEHAESAALVIEGEVHVDGTPLDEAALVVFEPGARPTLRAATPARVVLLGGASVGPRTVWWNFVSSSRARLEEAKRAWAEEREAIFPRVPGDEHERIPLPDPPPGTPPPRAEVGS